MHNYHSSREILLGNGNTKTFYPEILPYVEQGNTKGRCSLSKRSCAPAVDRRLRHSATTSVLAGCSGTALQVAVPTTWCLGRGTGRRPGVKLTAITDGTSNTALITEKYVNPKQYAGGTPADTDWDKPGVTGYVYNSLWGGLNPDTSKQTKPVTITGLNTRRNACGFGGPTTSDYSIVSTDKGGPYMDVSSVGTAHPGGFVPITFADGSVTYRRVILSTQVIINDGTVVTYNPLKTRELPVLTWHWAFHSLSHRSAPIYDLVRVQLRTSFSLHALSARNISCRCGDREAIQVKCTSELCKLLVAANRRITMPDVTTMVGFGLFCAIIGIGLYFLFGRARRLPSAISREKRLTHELADRVGCPLGYALEFVNRELSISPGESDATILKRAEYHLRRDLPDSASVRTYRK